MANKNWKITLELNDKGKIISILNEKGEVLPDIKPYSDLKFRDVKFTTLTIGIPNKDAFKGASGDKNITCPTGYCPRYIGGKWVCVRC